MGDWEDETVGDTVSGNPDADDCETGVFIEDCEDGINNGSESRKSHADDCEGEDPIGGELEGRKSDERYCEEGHSVGGDCEGDDMVERDCEG